jgi:hypothetical protein
MALARMQSFKKKIEEYNMTSHMLWWKRFGLTQEPRLDVHPLSPDDSRLFVRIQDSSVAKVFSNLEEPILFFKKIHAILGTFGSGKTSMVNYIRYNMHLKSIKEFSINIEWKPITEKIKGQHEIRLWFLKEIQAELIQACEIASIGATSNEKEALSKLKTQISDTNFDERSVLKSIAELSCFYEGFTIFIDELHKIPEYQYVLDFFKGEQSLFQNICRYPVAVFVACSETWEKNLQLDPYSGIFDEIVMMPFWGSRYAYKLIDTRLRDTAPDPKEFKNPFSPEAFDKIASLPKVKTPRDWIKTIKKVIDSTSEDVKLITSASVVKALLSVDNTTIDQIKRIGSQEYISGYRHLQNIAESGLTEATELLSVMAFLYHNPLARPLTQKTREKIGIEDLPLYLETLKNMKAVVEGTQSSQPIKVGRGAVEITQRDVYRLDNNITTFFEKIEEQFGLDPEDYILKIPEKEMQPVVQREIPTEEEKSLKKIKQIEELMKIPRAKNHAFRVIEDYEIFASGAFSQVPLTMQNFRSGMMAIYNLIIAAAVEKTKDEEHQATIREDLDLLKDDLCLDEDTISVISNLGVKFKEIEQKGKPLTDDFENIKRQILHVIEEVTDKESEWLNTITEIPPPATVETILAKVNQIDQQLSRPRSLLRNTAIHYCSALASRSGLKNVDDKWVENLYKVIRMRDIDNVLIDAIDIRCNPQLYPVKENQAYKDALIKLGLAFENSLLLVGRNHTNANIRKVFRESKTLTIKFMLIRLFDDGVLKETLTTYADFDRTKSTLDFEEKLKQLFGGKGKSIPANARAYTLTTLVRNFMAHEGNANTIANDDELTFYSIFDEMLFATISFFKYFVDRKLIHHKLNS